MGVGTHVSKLGAKRLILLAAVAVTAAAAAFFLLRGESGSEAETPASLLADCIAQHNEAATANAGNTDPDAAAVNPDAASGDPDKGNCGVGVESFTDLNAASNALGARIGADSPADYARSAAVLAHAARVRGVPGTHGRWRPVGKGPLIANDPTYAGTYGEGFGQLAGRISDYSYDAKHKVVYASVASGGVWMSKNSGASWRSIGNRLPTQTVGSVAYSRAHGGTIIAVTGDNAFGGNTYGGMGVFRSTNNGRTWKRARGVPTGAQGFKAAVDPQHPKVVYAATGAGLFRSANDGRSFKDVNLPIGGACQGKTFRRTNCFFANTVTDVVVQAKDKFGNRGSQVLAAVGWRAGNRKNFNGVAESPSNGLYLSANGRPGSFKRLPVDSNGFAPQDVIGRVELGAATGPKQNHGYVYALVQDAHLFNTGTLEGLDVPSGDPLGTGINPSATPTYLNGVYVSSDFGKTWTKMEGRQQFLLPTSGSTLAQLIALGFGPGIQSWYDEWIKPDPTKQTGNGVPTRVVLGLEELYENRLPVAQNGASDFKAIGTYSAQGAGCILVLAEPLCADLEQTTQATTTHPDQHSGTFIPDGHGGVTLVAGNDGGNYTQHVSSSGDFSNSSWGVGAQKGFHTLLPYGVSESKDGTVYAGLQDNGEMRIAPDGTQNETFGGDGVFTVSDPKNSNYVFEETPDAGTSVSTDGGQSWTDVNPLVDNPSFYAPLVMDPKNSNHVLTAGKEIVETTDGPNVTSPSTPPAGTDWKTVFNLGKSKRTGIDNQASALAVRGKSVYAGFCGSCDVVVSGDKFSNGIATNVGGKKKPQTGTSHGWHKVKAKGLPQRFISSITIDPHHKRTIYVTLGASDLRPYAGPHAAGNSGISSRGGHVYKSTNGGRSFHDISGNIHKLPALWSVVHGHQLVVATTNGVYASRGLGGRRFALLGKTLPRAPVFSLQNVPGHRRQILAASLGRGVYRYTFPKRR